MSGEPKSLGEAIANVGSEIADVFEGIGEAIGAAATIAARHYGINPEVKDMSDETEIETTDELSSDAEDTGLESRTLPDDDCDSDGDGVVDSEDADPTNPDIQ